MSTPVDLVVHGGVVVNADGSRPASIAVAGGRVVGLLDPEAPLPPHDRALDASGALVIPGGVDPHCHIGQRLELHQAQDDYASASVAALHGGTTTVIDFAIPDPGQSPLAEARARRGLAAGSRCDTALHGCVIRWDEGTAGQIAQMADEGVRTIKLFTTYRDAVMAEPETVLNVMRALRDVSGVAYVHAEANHVIEDAQSLALDAGRGHARHMAETRPELAEAAAVAQVLATAEYVGTPVYFVHLTTAEALDLVRDARRRGLLAYAESCPHYLTLDQSVYDGPHPERYVCCPPVRAAATVAELRKRVIAGGLDTIGSDHCCFTSGQKAGHAHDITEMPNGLPGIETRLPVSFTELVVRQGMAVERFVALFAANPARLNGLAGKGTISVGADADLVLIDPSATRTASARELHMATDYTPYEGMELAGWPLAVVSGGRVVLDAAGFHDPGPVGRALRSESMPPRLLT